MTRDAATLEREALRILAATRRAYPHYKHALDRVTIRLSTRLTRSAGNADPRTGVVQLSEPIFRLDENAHGYRNTVLHEIAHVIAGPDVRAHGPEWRAIFIEIGGNGRRTHEFRAAGQHRTHEAKCSSCGEVIELGTRRFNRLIAGARDYIHIGCGGTIVPPEGVEKSARPTDASIPEKVRYPAHCTRCGGTVPIGPIRYRRLLRGERAYRHRRCGGTIRVADRARDRGKGEGGGDDLTQRGLFDES